MPKRFPVSGTVTLDGQPLAEGVIYFKTIEKGSSEPCDIHGGDFKGQAEAGDRRVEICQFRTTVQDANGMKTEGESRPSLGWRQRSSDSMPTTRPVVSDTSG